MKYTNIIRPKIEKVFFKVEKSIMNMIYDRRNQFFEASMHDPNMIYMGPRAYNELMKNYSVSNPYISVNPAMLDLGKVMGMDIKVSSHLMDNEIIIMRTIES